MPPGLALAADHAVLRAVGHLHFASCGSQLRHRRVDWLRTRVADCAPGGLHGRSALRPCSRALIYQVPTGAPIADTTTNHHPLLSPRRPRCTRRRRYAAWCATAQPATRRRPPPTRARPTQPGPGPASCTVVRVERVRTATVWARVHVHLQHCDTTFTYSFVLLSS